MANAITALQTAGLTGTALWAEVAAAAELIGTVVVFVFGYRIIAKVVKGAAKGKVRL